MLHGGSAGECAPDVDNAVKDTGHATAKATKDVAHGTAEGAEKTTRRYGSRGQEDRERH